MKLWAHSVSAPYKSSHPTPGAGIEKGHEGVEWGCVKVVAPPPGGVICNQKITGSFDNDGVAPLPGCVN